MTGLVPSGIDEIGLLPGSHVCAFYRGDTDRDRLLNGYLGAGLTAGDKCICVVDSANTAKRLESLPGACGEPGPYTGQLDIHLPESTYLAGGEFTTSDMLTFWTEGMVKAEVEGYSFCRLVGEMTWALRDAPGVEHLVGYESELNRVTSSYPVVVLVPVRPGPLQRRGRGQHRQDPSPGAHPGHPRREPVLRRTGRVPRLSQPDGRQPQISERLTGRAMTAEQTRNPAAQDGAAGGAAAPAPGPARRPGPARAAG